MSNDNNSDIPRHAQDAPGAEVKATRREDGGVTVSFSDGSDDLEVSRREFMRISGVAAASAAMAGANCRYPKEEVVPYLDRPDEVEVGETTQYATTCNGCSAQCGAIVQTRAGRPIKLEGNPDHPVNEGSLCARGEASYRRLYDPDREQGPLKVARDGDHGEIDWQELDSKVVEKLQELKGGGSIRILSRNRPSSGRQALVDEIGDNFSDIEHYAWEPLTSEALAQASDLSYGSRHVPTYHFERADMVVSLGSDFLGTWLSPTEFTGQFVQNRDPDEEMSRFIAFEGMLTLTGMNADERHTVRTSDLVHIALGLAHEVIVSKGHGPLAGDADAEGAVEAFSPESVAERTGLDPQQITDYADELIEHAGHGLVIAGAASSSTPGGVSLEAAVNLLNAALENEGETVERARTSHQSDGSFADLQKLVDEMKAGEVDMLIVDEANPIYSAPPDLGFEAALENVNFVVATSDRVNETARLADYLATGTHYLEAWGDANPRDGLYSLQQPTIQPLHNTRPMEESLLVWFGNSGIVDNFKSFLQAPDKPQTNKINQNVPHDAGSWYRYLRAHWEESIYPESDPAVPFDNFWEGVLREGSLEIAPADEAQPAFRTTQTVEVLPDGLPEPTDNDPGDLTTKELQTFASIPLYDGRTANLGHMQELPDPLTKHTWGSYILLSPRTFKEADLEQGDILSVKVASEDGTTTKRRFPAIMQPGMHDDVVAVPLGYGRTHAGVVASDPPVGENAFALTRVSNGVQALAGLDATVDQTPDHKEVSIVQGSQVLDLAKRPLLGTANKETYDENHSAGVGTHPPKEMLWDAHDYDLKWGMSIDLTKCTGCSACVTACQEENNIPVVGRQGIMEGREMHWMRIDRYFIMPLPGENEEFDKIRADVNDDPMLDEDPYIGFAKELPETMENPRTVMQPMLCQHCEQAPCETVCPVAATTHSDDGLNQMSYNRCVGTRYCSNNCPFKVRRFNWFNYSSDRGDGIMAKLTPEMEEHGRLNVEEPLPLGFNPDVTVRSRGVMEKCTFCVQRIRRAKWQKSEENRDTYREDDVVTACEQACPADAINFGDISEGSDHTVRKDHDSPRAVSPLAHINVRSSIAYLTDIRNTDVGTFGQHHGQHHGGGHGGGDHGGGGDHAEGGGHDEKGGGHHKSDGHGSEDH